jgi:hypothetical protein
MHDERKKGGSEIAEPAGNDALTGSGMAGTINSLSYYFAVTQFVETMFSRAILFNFWVICCSAELGKIPSAVHPAIQRRANIHELEGV